MALMVLASRAMRLKNAPRFTVLSVDHGLRPGAKQEVQHVAAWSKRLGLKHVTLTIAPIDQKSRVQEAARLARYQAMAAWCKNHKAGALVLGHHQDDQAETVLMRLLHGSGVNGLGGMNQVQHLQMPRGRVTLLRPFLAHRRADLRDFLQRADQPWIEDPSNENRQYERVRVRAVLPALEALGAGAEGFAAIAANMQKARAQLDAQACQWLDQHGVFSEYGFITVARAPFRDLSAAAQQRLLARLIGALGGHIYAPKRARLDGLATRISATPSGAATLAGCLVRWRGQELMIGRELAALRAPSATDQTQFATPTRGMRLWDGRFGVSLTPRQVARGIFIAPLGPDGLAQYRQAGGPVPKQVPASYLHVLPAFFDSDGLLACPPLAPKAGFRAARDTDKIAFTALFGVHNTGKAQAAYLYSKKGG